MNQQPNFQQNKQPYFGGQPQQSTSMQEKDLVLDLLGSAKALADGYCTQTEEAACPQLRKIMMENWQHTVDDQYAIFEAMRARNWYPTKDAQPQEIAQTKQTYAQAQQQLQ